MANLLVVEDEQSLLQTLRRGLHDQRLTS